MEDKKDEKIYEVVSDIGQGKYRWEQREYIMFTIIFD